LSIPEGGTSLENVEHTLVELALQQSHGNQIRAAKLLDISRDALRYKMKKFGLCDSEEEESHASTIREKRHSAKGTFAECCRLALTAVQRR
jgi:Zn-dependent peptidase ImmA (M78 family)